MHRGCPTAVLLALALFTPAGSPASGERDDPDSLAQGVVARFQAGSARGVEAVRLSPTLSWDWTGGPPDPRLPAVGFRLDAGGSLLVQVSGSYRFFLRGAQTRSALRVAGKIISEGNEAARPSTPIDLRVGFVPIRVEAETLGGQQGPKLSVDWEGPNFAREAVPARLLFHDRGASPAADRFEQGRRLADRLGCGNCHAGTFTPHKGLGPPLPSAVRGADPRWLSAWLRDPVSVRPVSSMPSFGHGLSVADAADLVAYLTRPAPREKPVTAEVRMALNVASPEKGRLLFRSIGCLGCHGKNTAGGESRLVAPDLEGVGRSRSPLALAAYLEHPRGDAPGSAHRPDLRLSADESAHLAAYLTADVEPLVPAGPLPDGDPDRGAALAGRLRCASCHVVPGQTTVPSPVRLSSLRPDAGCLSPEPPPGKPDVPRYALDADQREALRAFVAGLPDVRSPIGTEVRAEDAVRRLNCLGCHTRDGRGGADLSERLAPLLSQDPALGGLKGTLTPPNLTAVGDKLRPEYLTLAVRGEAPTARPWLSARMPAFAFEAGEAEAIASWFRDHDRITPEAPRSAATPLQIGPDARNSAARLIGQRGFGCVSCHVLSGRIPPGGEPETLGPDLALSGRRMTEGYFRRWIADPQRIIAGTPMPQFLKPVEGVPGTLDDQLKALWRLLNSDSLSEVTATGTRETLKREGDRAMVVRDMVLVPALADNPYTPRGLAVGFKNDVSLLFDTDRLGWLSAWQGGFLSRTKTGRLWEWHPEGAPIWTASRRLSPVALVGPDGSVRVPDEESERFGTFSELEFEGDGVRLRYRLRCGGGRPLDVTEEVRPIDRGWERTVRVANPPDGFLPYLVEQPPAGAAVGEGGRTYTWTEVSSTVTLRLPSDRKPRPSYPGEAGAVLSPCTPEPGHPFSGSVTVRVGRRG